MTDRLEARNPLHLTVSDQKAQKPGPGFPLFGDVSPHCRVKIYVWSPLLGRDILNTQGKCFCVSKNWNWRQSWTHHLPWEHQFCLLPHMWEGMVEDAFYLEAHRCHCAHAGLCASLLPFDLLVFSHTNSKRAARGCCSLCNISAQAQNPPRSFLLGDLQS